MASDSDSASSVGDKVFRCTWKNHLGQSACSATFTRAYSLRRHELRSHQTPLSTTFIYQTPSSNGRRRSIHTAGGSQRSIRAPATSTPTFFGSRMFLGLGLQDPRPTSAPSFGPTRGAAPTSAFHSPTSRDSDYSPGSTTGTFVSPIQSSDHDALCYPPFTANQSAPATPWPQMATANFQDDSDTESATTATDAIPGSTVVSRAPSTAEVVSSTNEAMVLDESRPLLPRYEIRLSKTTPGQPKALDWLTTEGKAKFTEFEDAILNRWGQSRGHRSTCLLVCEDWRHSDPLDIMALFSLDNIPAVGSPRAKFSYKDHGVSFVRAKVWFEKLHRTAGDLDVFLNTGDCKPMDASHLCHHEHCIKHVVYEPAHINHDRQECCNRAKFLRSEGRDVSEHCTAHDPPCMMQ
ncbi:MAG: hypothetical protein Q9180_005428, partial [Flavoplaca navasiana]